MYVPLSDISVSNKQWLSERLQSRGASVIVLVMQVRTYPAQFQAQTDFQCAETRDVTKRNY